MQYIGKINIENFNGISDKKLLTDEVILTDKQREHIAERHQEVFGQKRCRNGDSYQITNS